MELCQFCLFLFRGTMLDLLLSGPPDSHGSRVQSLQFHALRILQPCHTKDLTRDFADIIEVQLYGDHSNDEFRMIWDKNEDGSAEAVSAVLVSAGVTPRKHCNPSWRLFEARGLGKQRQIGWSNFSSASHGWF